MKKIIETFELTKYYGKHLGIKDINLSVHEGEIFGFIGSNGAGKSTTIRTLLGLINASSGKAEIFDKEISKNKEYILSHIGYMPSESNFYGDMRVGEVIKYSSQLRKLNCDEEAKKLVDRFELDAKKKISELSLGNRKKVNIVCAMQHKPKLYIFDEPTSGLDPLMQREFWDLVKERNKEGATVFLSSHILSEVQHYCHRAAIISNGSLVMTSAISEIIKSMAKRIVITGISSDFYVEGIKNLKVNGDVASFLYSGDINMILRELSKTEVKDLIITEPDLDEIFMYYYERSETR
ncbi:MAG TPA: ABC transporter ATP-binding protein [Clostridiaceae bacterium]|nr:ABC transporter ATP-binding protein [Clostridiaceae bacterium]